MSATNNGGPAFPAPDLGEQDFSQRGAYPGMTLRDYFAAKAMQGMVSSFVNVAKHDAAQFLRDMPNVAYEMADAMLAARSTKAEGGEA